MAKLVFVDFETFGMPGAPEKVWQFAYGSIDTSSMDFWKNIQFFSGIIDWRDRDMSVIPKESVDFTNKWTPDAFKWIQGEDSPYKLFSLEEFEQETINWFRSQGCATGGAFQDWQMVGRYPEFDYHCFSERVRKEINLTPFKCQDFALMYSTIVRNTYQGRLPNLDSIKIATKQLAVTHHDALMDIKDEIQLTMEAWIGIQKYWAQKTQK